MTSSTQRFRTRIIAALISLCAACGFDHPNWLTKEDGGGSGPTDSGSPPLGDGGVAESDGSTGSAGTGGSAGDGSAGAAESDAGSALGPRGFTVGLWTTGGGGDVVSGDHRLRIVIGEPQPMGRVDSADHTVRFGPTALATQSIP